MSEPHPSDRPLIEARKWAEAHPERAVSHHNDCMSALDLAPQAIEAFARRQEILIAERNWPLTRWYTDEDFCRAYNTAVALAAENSRMASYCSGLVESGAPLSDSGMAVAERQRHRKLADAMLAVSTVVADCGDQDEREAWEFICGQLEDKFK